MLMSRRRDDGFVHQPIGQRRFAKSLLPFGAATHGGVYKSAEITACEVKRAELQASVRATYERSVGLELTLELSSL